MFYFKIDKLRILDNGGVKSGLGVFGHDFAKVRFLSIITPSDQVLPDLDQWLRDDNAKAKKAALETLVSNSLRTLIVEPVDRVEDNSDVFFGDTGLLLYDAEKIPEELTWTFMAIRSERDVRETALSADEMLEESGATTVARKAFGLLKAGSLANPGYAAGLAVAEFVAKVALRRFKRRRDKQLGNITTSFIRSLHYPSGSRVATGVPDSTGNLFFDYSIFGYRRAVPVNPNPQGRIP
jgi:hypothetical protein